MSNTENIWFTEPDLGAINGERQAPIHRALGIEITEIGSDFVRGTMPADERTHQPMGLIHGGANVVLAESLGSIGANLIVDNSQYYCVGQEVNANHLRGVSSGKVTGTAKLMHSGRTSQVWQIEIENDEGKLTCVSRLTMAVVKYA